MWSPSRFSSGALAILVFDIIYTECATGSEFYCANDTLVFAEENIIPTLERKVNLALEAITW